VAPAHPIHIINPLWNAYGGSERRVLSLYALLKDHAKVFLWSGLKPDPRLTSRYQIHVLRPRLGHFPRRGTFVFVGIYAGIGHWIESTKPHRTIVVINTVQPELAERTVDRVAKAGPFPEIVYASEATRVAHRLPGIVEPSPIDVATFTPAMRAPNARFTVGRLSRDDAAKHHEDDPAFYCRLVEEGCSVRVMGGRVLAGKVPGGAPSHLELLPPGAESAPGFLQRLDCFFYRTASDWFETYGRVVFEAMACGLPVVASRRGGYADGIADGENGFLFDRDEEALSIILRLRDDSGLRDRIGRSARATAERLYAPAALDAIRGFYLRDAT
jgi:glycosyltransferase involved in cell wall biosynthesis